MEYRAALVVVVAAAIAFVGLNSAARYHRGAQSETLQNAVQAEGGLTSNIQDPASDKLLKYYCMPLGIKDATACAEAKSKVIQTCEDKKAQAEKSEVLKRFKSFMKDCEEVERIKLLEMAPDEESFTGELGKAVKVCELDVRDVCERWTCPTFCKMAYSGEYQQEECTSSCGDKCKAVNMIAGSITPDPDADETGYDLLKKMQAEDADIILQAFLREHLVKCTCQRRTWEFNKQDWGDVCYMGGQGLKPGQKWCSWDGMPSWQALKKESGTQEYEVEPGTLCAVKPGVQLAILLTTEALSKDQLAVVRGALAKALDTPDAQVDRRNVIHLRTEKKDGTVMVELHITNPQWPGTGEKAARSVQKKLVDLFRGDVKKVQELYALQAKLDPANRPRVTAAMEVGDGSSRPPADGSDESGAEGRSVAGLAMAALAWLLILSVYSDF